MTLVPDAAQKGLWINPDLKPKKAGVYALIIGVSRYDYLAGSAQAAAKTYGLGQLAVSALTAYRFFQWLRDGYFLSGWPVAKVRLLLAPREIGVCGATEDELAGCDTQICNNAIEATFLNCKNAIENWYADMEAIAPDCDGRSLFFFTGHGLEITRNHQVLLPSDYLHPPIRAFNDCISTRNLIDHLPTLQQVSSHILLLDACRNDLKELRQTKVEGAQIFTDEDPGATNGNSLAGVLHSTQSGHQAYQPKSKSDGISLFGQALLDGLKTIPNPTLDEAPIQLNCHGGVCRVEINNLTSYIKGRVDALVRAARESIVQSVRLDVSSTDPNNRKIELNELGDLQPSSGIPGSPLGAGTGERASAGFAARVLRSAIGPLGREATSPPRQVSVEDRAAWLERRYSDREILASPVPGGATENDDLLRLHDLFDSEAITYPWHQSLRISGLGTGEEFDQSAVEIISTRQAYRTPTLHRVQVHLRLGPVDPVGHLLTIEDDGKQKFGCILPGDSQNFLDEITHLNPIYQLEIDVDTSDPGRGLFIRFAASLSPKNTDQLGTAARAWERLRALSPAAATDLIERDNATGVIEQVSDEMNRIWATTGQREEFYRESERTLSDKVESPLAAAVAGLILLKANRFDLMHDWTRNVGNWFPWLPDGIVLWTEQCRRTARGRPLDQKLISWFVDNLSSRGLPFTSDCLGLAADILRDVLRDRKNDDGRSEPTIKDEAILSGALVLNSRIGDAMESFRDDALFCTYADWEDIRALRALVGPPTNQHRQEPEEIIEVGPGKSIFDFLQRPAKAKPAEPDEEAPSAGAT
jgi:hypothetical protein